MTEIFDNIRKLYRFLSPQEDLLPYIEFFSETDLVSAASHIQEEAFTVKLFPSYTPTIWMNLGSPYQLKNGNRVHKIDEREDVLVLRSETIERRNSPNDNIFTVKFEPGGFETIFGYSQSRIGNEVIALPDLMPTAVISKIKQAPDFQERVKIWEEYLLMRKSFHTDNHYCAVVHRSIHAYLDADKRPSTNALAHSLHMGERSLNRYFHRIVGTGPKNYFNILRARTSLTNFLKDRPAFAPETYGYYDMSHFYRDALRFTGTRISDLK